MFDSPSTDDRPVAQPKSRRTNYLKFCCRCTEPRILRMAPRTHARGGVLCGVCFRPFEPEDDDR